MLDLIFLYFLGNTTQIEHEYNRTPTGKQFKSVEKSNSVSNFRRTPASPIELRSESVGIFLNSNIYLSMSQLHCYILTHKYLSLQLMHPMLMVINPAIGGRDLCSRNSYQYVAHEKFLVMSYSSNALVRSAGDIRTP